MPTPKLDKLATKFITKIPTTFKTAFEPGTMAMPDSEVLSKKDIIRYINEAMITLFNLKYNEAFQYAKGKEATAIKYFVGLFPELVKSTTTLTTDVEIEGTAYIIDTPYLDVFKVISAIGKDNQFIKVWDATKFTLVLSAEYEEYTATEEDPALIQMNNIIFIFPTDISDFTFKFQYIKLPVNPTTGGELEQNGEYDSPFSIQWDNNIVDIAYGIYQQEAQETL